MKDRLYSLDLSELVWHKSSYSQPDNCVEVAAVTGGVAVRDSKRPERAPLLFDDDEWQAFVRGAAAGEFG